jgi:proline dehydrogenase
MTVNDSSISFENTELAFKYKGDKDLKQARMLFSLMAKPLLVKLGTHLTPWAIRNKLPVKGLVRSTIFRQFAGGETLQETARVAELLGKYQVQVILDYAVEGGDNSEADFEQAAGEFMKVIDYAATQPNIPFMSIKVTGLSRFALLDKMNSLMRREAGGLIPRLETALVNLTAAEREEWERLSSRLHTICEKAREKKVGMLIDAEETWIQDPMDALLMQMMEKFNRERAVIYNTIQLYRHDRLEFLRESHRAASENGYILGMKLVRGAYMEKERNRALAMNYPSPIQADKKNTDRDFDESVRFCIEHIDRISTIISTHNENSNLLGARLLQEKGLPANHPHVHFSQLFGMSDNITFNLAHAGCNVSKYLPFGPIEDVIPYLMRRAEENTSVGGQTGRELGLINREFRRRHGEVS